MSIQLRTWKTDFAIQYSSIDRELQNGEISGVAQDIKQQLATECLSKITGLQAILDQAGTMQSGYWNAHGQIDSLKQRCNRLLGKESVPKIDFAARKQELMQLGLFGKKVATATFAPVSSAQIPSLQTTTTSSTSAASTTDTAAPLTHFKKLQNMKGCFANRDKPQQLPKFVALKSSNLITATITPPTAITPLTGTSSTTSSTSTPQSTFAATNLFSPASSLFEGKLQELLRKDATSAYSHFQKESYLVRKKIEECLQDRNPEKIQNCLLQLDSLKKSHALFVSANATTQALLVANDLDDLFFTCAPLLPKDRYTRTDINAYFLSDESIVNKFNKLDKLIPFELKDQILKKEKENKKSIQLFEDKIKNAQKDLLANKTRRLNDLFLATRIQKSSSSRRPSYEGEYGCPALNDAASVPDKLQDLLGEDDDFGLFSDKPCVEASSTRCAPATVSKPASLAGSSLSVEAKQRAMGPEISQEILADVQTVLKETPVLANFIFSLKSSNLKKQIVEQTKQQSMQAYNILKQMFEPVLTGVDANNVPLLNDARKAPIRDGLDELHILINKPGNANLL